MDIIISNFRYNLRYNLSNITKRVIVVKKNVLELCMSPDLGGLELYVKRLSFYLSEEVNLFLIVNSDGKLREKFMGINVELINYKKTSIIGSIFLAKKIAKIIDEKDIDILHIHWTKDILLAVLSKLFSKKKPKLVQSRHMRMTRFKSDFYHKFLYKNIDVMIAVTQQVREQLGKFIPSDIRPKLYLSYIGTNKIKIIEPEYKKELIQKYKLENSFVLGIVGRIEEAKGQYLLIEALKELQNENIKNVKLLVIGHTMNSEYLEKLKNKVTGLLLDKNVIFTGFSSEVQNLMQVCDTVVLATKNETFGLVLIEAMASNICVIGSNRGGPLEIIEDNVSGLLFESLNAQDLAAKIKELYANLKLKEKLVKNAKQRVDDLFDDKKQFLEVKQILQESL